VNLQWSEKIGVREQVRNVRAIGKIAKVETQIYCTANMQAEPQTVQGRVKKACLCVVGLVPKV